MKYIVTLGFVFFANIVQAVEPAIIWASFVHAEEPSREEPLRVYLSPNGSDYNQGLSRSAPIRTLARAQQVLQVYDLKRPIEIHVGQGTYWEQSVEWTYTNGHSITFTPVDFSKDRPVFDGNGVVETWFKLEKSDGVNSNLRFRYLKVQNYATAVSFNGNRGSLSTWNGGNELYGMYFYRIGGIFSHTGYSTAAVRLKNSRNNSVVNSHFVDILNYPDDASAIHAVYIAHYSSGNELLRNRFLRINGDPIKVRDESNHNYIADNKFYSSGEKAFYQGWYCNADVKGWNLNGENPGGCTKPSGECPSIGNEFRNNHLYGGYVYPYSTSGGAVKVFNIRGSDDYCGPLSEPRLRTSGNIVYY